MSKLTFCTAAAQLVVSGRGKGGGIQGFSLERKHPRIELLSLENEWLFCFVSYLYLQKCKLLQEIFDDTGNLSNPMELI